MKYTLSFFLLSIFSFYSDAQSEFNGTWLGIVQRAGQKTKDASLLYLKIEGNDNAINGYTREEMFDTENFAVKQIKGFVKNDVLKIEQVVVQKSKQNNGAKWCRFNAELKYNSTTGYLEGDFISTDCKRVIGKLLLYRFDYSFSTKEKNEISQLWFTQLIKDLDEGLNAPEIRKKERDNFKFEPIYFDYDEAFIRPDHYDFLNRLIKVVKGHTDLRVLVTGHTDSDGSDGYNDDLSKRRAEMIVQYFVQHGLSADRLEFDFKGEKQPVDSNNTPEGKQHNRRVDFRFI